MIKQSVVDQILDRELFIQKLATKYEVTTGTVIKWYRYKHPKILNYNLMVMLAEELNCNINELVD